ncbi:uncharacterized protein F4822DRAFT_296932 [Hypoxylon trugodes]|uniref:uncharacterized protein n=1 Tax=Hypoxylon trugodes TaxID=326681 RepID=UPI00219980FA|nr:uncharacterized protein F4822DRAFT_296932 [Hypoxylon trugodes]KAI1387953.1 hypothetical protein F4822DRAFT_296932 [Hypoxylon trugodes]
MHQPLYVLVYPSPLFAAHWSFWLPYIDSNRLELNTGDRIHVTGDRFNGFSYEYIPNYNISEDDRHPNAFPIGLVPEAHLSRVGEDGNVVSAGESQEYTEKIPLNAFDKACKQVPAPGPSLNKVNITDSSQASITIPKRTEVKDCQWWIKQTTSHLVRVGLLLPLDERRKGESPILRVENLPRH